MTEQKKPKPKPKHEIRVGTVKAAIWESDGAKGSFHTVTFSRLYKADGRWKVSHRFSGRELLSLARVVSQAAEWIEANEKKE